MTQSGINKAIKILDIKKKQPFIDAHITEAYNMGICALKKQIPKKPAFKENDNYYCPNCCTNYKIIDQYDYCPKCGQRIDWSMDL